MIQMSDNTAMMISVLAMVISLISMVLTIIFSRRNR